MREETAGKGVGLVESEELFHGELGIEMADAQCVVTAVPREQGRVGVDVGHVEGAAERVDAVPHEHRRARVSQIVHRRASRASVSPRPRM
jgi:hypothetical protein